jgi:tRNA splicing ligase
MDQFLDDLSEMERQKELRKTKVQFNSFDVISYKIQNEAFRTSKVKARGLFIASKSKVKDSTNEISNLSNLHINHDQFIACRGYDKFYNLDEYPEITWVELEQNTKGPYEVTLKENGCIIFISALGNQLLITSKHSITGQHSKKAKEWLLIHLLSTNQTESSFLEYLQQNKFTAVFELADDDFEEHVLEYSKENSGLYLRNKN